MNPQNQSAQRLKCELFFMPVKIPILAEVLPGLRQRENGFMGVSSSDQIPDTR
jgi:hypothetical protein